ncbi:MAG TPA: 3-isopropylmalate dehydratase small subunit [Hyphomicrobiaceae bacterium]|jgi:3-isopropylmalate/(R)-2-methylmalate dehydratase small subunit|nr:3-isopropylmalate dehydratase small subunit [Hyphomicrobiaceae bacterium]HEX2337706.1 3-isopropylmalate dehydratase small subunit [Hyphomicrobiaceae bacterium]
MSLKPFERLDAIAVPITQPNLDTDQILPARYLQKPRANNFGEYLFRDLRFGKDGSEQAGFVLNQTPYRDGRIILAARNFGCGSSREHAVWALHDYGFRAVIAPSFGDIFYANALKNGLLPIPLPEPSVLAMLDTVQAAPGSRMVVDLEAQTVLAPDGASHTFDINAFSKHCLLKGLDELGYTLGLLDQIADFERRFEQAGS